MISKPRTDLSRRQNERAQKQLPGQFFVTGPTAVFGKELGSGFGVWGSGFEVFHRRDTRCERWGEVVGG